jgi:small-conductance mechanosensitive channel
MTLDGLFHNALIIKFVWSIFLGLVFWLFYILLSRVALGHARKKSDMFSRRKILVNTRNFLVVIFFIALALLWLDQLKNLAAGILVVALALVIATRELLINFLGFLYRAGANSFSVGDRISIGEIHGDVLDLDVLGVTLLEVGPIEKNFQYTGRTIFVPNAKFMSEAVSNESYYKDYAFHIISLPVAKNKDWRLREKALLKSALKTCSPYLEESRKYMHELEKRFNLDAPSVDPAVHVHIVDTEKINLNLRIPLPVKRRGRVEQEIIRGYLNEIKKLKNRLGSTDKK